MNQTIRGRISAVTALILCLATLAAAGQVSPGPGGAPPAPIFRDTADAHQVREQLQRLLRQHPPAVGEVLQRDASLLTRADYLAPYPALAAFLAQHPEVARNPEYFLGSFHYYERNPNDRAFDMFGMLLGGMAGTTLFIVVISVLVWLIRAIIDHRRWLRLSRIQTDVHTKLMDRLTTNEELLAYIQSPAGRRFLESAPIALDGEPKPAAAPLGRILWALQAGIVLMALGVGFWFVRMNVIEEAAQAFYALGVIAMSVGAGFAVAALVSYVISTRLGLLPGVSREPRSS
jgi:hypothetical protein